VGARLTREVLDKAVVFPAVPKEFHMRNCEWCEEPLHESARNEARFCSGKCRLASLRAKRKGAKAVTTSLEAWEPGYHAVTDNPPPTPPPPLVTANPPPTPPPPLVTASRPSQAPSRASSKYTEEELRIPDDLTIPKFLRREPDAPHWKDYDK